MESRITGVAAKADERQHNAEREKERERNSGGKKKSVQQDEDLLVHSRPDPTDLPSAPLFSPCSRRSHQPTSGSPLIHMAKGARGGGKLTQILSFFPHLFWSHRTWGESSSLGRGIPYCGVPSLRELITGPEEGKTFASKMQMRAQDPTL